MNGGVVSGIMSEDERFRRLEALRRRIDIELAEIAAAKRRRRIQLEESARKHARRIEGERKRSIAKDLEARAPADLVRTWAREQGIKVGDRGRLSNQLRVQYLEATGEPVDRSATRGAPLHALSAARLAGAERSTDLPAEATG